MRYAPAKIGGQMQVIALDRNDPAVGYPTVDKAVKAMGTYNEPVQLPDGRRILPLQINYPYAKIKSDEAAAAQGGRNGVNIMSTLSAELQDYAKQYGTVDFEGKRYYLTQDAYPDNYGTDGDVRYYARAIDIEGDIYMVAWDTTGEWDEAQAEAQRLQAAGDPCDDYPAILDDESNACDWDHPVDVKAI